MTNAQAQALARMQAANAALTPAERKARSAKAAAASAAKTKAIGPFPQGGSAKRERDAAPRAPLPVIAWRVTTAWKREDSGTEALVTCDVSAATPRQAIKQGRKLARPQAPADTTWGGLVALVRADALDFAA